MEAKGRPFASSFAISRLNLILFSMQFLFSLVVPTILFCVRVNWVFTYNNHSIRNTIILLE